MIICAIAFSGCDQKPQVRHYTEIIIPADQVADHMPGVKLAWDVPSAWSQGAGDGMRLGTFHLASDPSAFDCSIVSLPGGAGGLEANLKRWMGQINLDISDGQLAQFIAASKGRIFDFTQLQKDRDVLTPSMLVAMLNMRGTTVFIKMKGSIAAINENKGSFLALVKSVRIK